MGLCGDVDVIWSLTVRKKKGVLSLWSKNMKGMTGERNYVCRGVESASTRPACAVSSITPCKQTPFREVESGSGEFK